MEALYNITPVLVNILGKIQLKKFSYQHFLQIVEKQKTRKKPMTKAAKPRCVFRRIIKIAKQGKRNPKKRVQHRFKKANKRL